MLAPLGHGCGVCVQRVPSRWSTRNGRAGRLPDAATPLVACPPHGDWSFPSNHATIAGAAAVALALAWRGTPWLTAPLALLMAFSRVFVGVHYPHDVRSAGLALGALVALCSFVRLTTRSGGTGGGGDATAIGGGRGAVVDRRRADGSGAT